MKLDYKKIIENQFNLIFDLEDIDRTAIWFKLIPSWLKKTITILEKTSIDSNCVSSLLNPINAGQIKPFLSNKKLKKSAVYRQGIGYELIDKMEKNKSLSAQKLSIIMNHALASLTTTLGSEVVLDSKNKLYVDFFDHPDSVLVEMRVTISVFS